MTDEGGEEDPPESERGGEDSENSADQQAEAAELAERLKKISAQPGVIHGMVAVTSERIKIVFSASGITDKCGDPGKVGRLLVAVNRYYEAARANFVMSDLAFGNSVEIYVEPRVTARELERLRESLGEASDPAEMQVEAEAISPAEVQVDAEADGPAEMQVEAEAISPAEVQVETEVTSALLPAAIRNFEHATRILSEPSGRVQNSVRSLPTGAGDELRKLGDALVKDQADLLVDAPRMPTVKLGPRKAKRIADNLREPEELDTDEVTIVGKLTRTDSEAEEFRVELDRSKIPPLLAHGRRTHVQGTYSATASAQVRDKGLWDKVVVADVEVKLVRSPGGRVRPGEFRFVSVVLASTQQR